MELELERAKKIIKSIAQDPDYILECEQAERYYRGINDITFPEKVPKPWIGKTASGGLRRANNRVSLIKKRAISVASLYSLILGIKLGIKRSI